VKEGQCSPDMIEQFMISSMCLRTPQLPEEMRNYHLRMMNETPEQLGLLQALGLTIQSLQGLDSVTYAIILNTLCSESD